MNSSGLFYFMSKLMVRVVHCYVFREFVLLLMEPLYICIKYKNKNEIIIENMLSMQTENFSSEEMFWILEKMSDTGKIYLKLITS